MSLSKFSQLVVLCCSTQRRPRFPGKATNGFGSMPLSPPLKAASLIYTSEARPQWRSDVTSQIKFRGQPSGSKLSDIVEQIKFREQPKLSDAVEQIKFREQPNLF